MHNSDIIFLYIIKELGIGIVAYSPLGQGFLSVGAKFMKSRLDGDVQKVIF